MWEARAWSPGHRTLWQLATGSGEVSRIPPTYPGTSLAEIPKQSVLSSLDLARPKLPPSLLSRFLFEGELRSTAKKEKCR